MRTSSSAPVKPPAHEFPASAPMKTGEAAPVLKFCEPVPMSAPSKKMRTPPAPSVVQAAWCQTPSHSCVGVLIATSTPLAG